MKIKPSDLTGAALDWAVEEIELRRRVAAGERVKSWVLRDHKAGGVTGRYSSDWCWGGEIIEREGIGFGAQKDFKPGSTLWEAGHTTVEEVGPTPLIAAMRCYCASKLGDEVDVPEELSK